MNEKKIDLSLDSEEKVKAYGDPLFIYTEYETLIEQILATFKFLP